MSNNWNLMFQSLICAFITLSHNFSPVITFMLPLDRSQPLTRYRRQALITNLQTGTSHLNKTAVIQPSQIMFEYGVWGPWSERSNCSRSCGGGITYQDRICLDVREDGRQSCIGSSRRYFSCNVDDCPPNTKDFRTQQCEEFNSALFNGKYHSWIPYYKAQAPCELNCMPEDGSFYAMLEEKVIDGTRCWNDGSYDICVDGRCMAVGCDKVLGSITKLDECHVCGGDGRSCRIFKGILDEDNFEIGYNDILMIPAGATSILIQEVRATNNHFALRNAAGMFYLNANWRIESSREIKVAGTVFHYERKQWNAVPEFLRAQGPTNESIFVMLMYQEKNLGISYEFSIPVTVKAPKQVSYEWIFGDFEECSRTCGGGVQHRTVRCIRKSDRAVVDDGLCNSLLKPTTSASCNTKSCPTAWHLGEWSECSQSCRGGTQFRPGFCHQSKEEGAFLVPDNMCEDPKPLFMRACNVEIPCPDWVLGEWSECEDSCNSSMQSRVANCTNNNGVYYPDDACDPAKCPELTKPCPKPTRCEAVWHASEWSECNRTCGNGNRTRKVECSSERETLDSSFCEADKKPVEFESCTLGPCEEVNWIVSEWSECEDTCNPSIQSREVHCANEDGKVFLEKTCDSAKMPEVIKSCPKPPRCEAMWHASEWSECDPKCGEGNRTRTVNCSSEREQLDPSLCDAGKKPIEFENCTLGPCEEVKWRVSDWSECEESCISSIQSRLVYCANENDMLFPDDDCDAAEIPAITKPCPKPDRCKVMRQASEWSKTVYCNQTQGSNITADECGVCGGNGSLCTFFKGTLDGYEFEVGYNDILLLPVGATHILIQTVQPTSNYLALRNSAGEFYLNGNYRIYFPGKIEIAGTTFQYERSSRRLTPESLRAEGPINETIFVALLYQEKNLGISYEYSIPVTTKAQFDEIKKCSQSDEESAHKLGCIDNGNGLIISCETTVFGCCSDNVTVAKGYDKEGCASENCGNSSFGCCPDTAISATGPNNEGCYLIDCPNTAFGCCPDNETAATGPDYEGCDTPIDCANTTYGCCPDEVTTALGNNLEGCCFGMRFGCCPDNKTAALGPTFLGCPCHTYPYGCCPDGINPAQGFDYEVCTCEHFRYGCCQDNITPATGPNFEGCLCHLLRYGCCPDGRTPIINDKGDGCTCDSTRYGCCPDFKTSATSTYLSGCPCYSLPYGCCTDGYTPARSSDLRDCPCTAQRYGCCLDGRTVAQGPNYEGCPCDATRFGCCLDGKTTAQGPNFYGCPCETMRYGCCADGYTPAQGPKYEGCPDIVQPKPKIPTEVCGLPKDSGPCRNFSVMWYFDVNYGSCSRFWYGGCDGNGNKFATVDECENTCVKPDGPEACLLPKTVGSCNEKIPLWYYDAGSENCESFTYGGCLGNNNRFVTKEACEQKCINLQPQVPVNMCELSKDEGPCDKPTIQWYYNKENSRCEQFYYGGCKGNANRFETRRECEKSCVASVVHEQDICRLPQEIGNCAEFRERWFFDYENGECHRFMFSGCEGNENNFASFVECEKRCSKETVPEEPTDRQFKTEYCFLNQDPGPCNLVEVNWYYNAGDGVCKEFYYGGCKGNQNRFKTRKECETSCFQAQDACSLAVVKGSCSGSFTQWYYDKDQEDCLEFIFTGCQGNANRFNTKESCYQRCKKEKLTTPAPVLTDDLCALPQEPGPCLGYYRRWYYDTADNLCKSFVYGGCEGNRNRFEIRTDCEATCVKKTVKVYPPPVAVTYPPPRTSNEDVCRLPVEPGPCNEAHPRWFYDAQTQNCLPFVFGGCGGNKNRFKTSEICLRFCTGITAVHPERRPFSVQSTTSTSEPTQCPPSNCANIQCPFGIEESFDFNGCSSCRCSNPCEVHECPAGSRCAIDVVRTSREAIRTEPVCRRVNKPGTCPVISGPGRDCETRCRDDADCRGDHKCCNNGCAMTCVPPEDDLLVPATQPEPAQILPGSNLTEGTIGEPAELPCNAVGWPRPTVTWWRDTTMLPLSSRRYEQLSSYALLIRSVAYEDAGDYACHAHNGIGSGAIFKVTLVIDLQPEPTLPAVEETDFNSRDSEPVVPKPFEFAPLETRVSLVTNDPTVGAPLQIDCSVKGPSEAMEVTWHHQNQLITESDRKRLLSNHTLFITKAEGADSGEYRCNAEYENSFSTSAIHITVKEASPDNTCIDNPQFSNCELIVRNSYCNNKFYGRFCCASCMKAGQLETPPDA